MLDRFLEFSDALRSAGVPVSTSEQTDAITAIRHVDPSHRGSFKAAVAAAMIKSESHRPQFDALFDLYFGTVPSEAPHHQPDDTGRDRNELVRDLVDALFAGDAVALGELAREAVARFGRLQNSPSGDWYSNYQVMRALDLDSIADLLEATLEEADLSPLEERLARDEFARRVAEFRAMALADTRRRVAAQRGPAAVARYAVNPVLEELPFLSATADLTEMRKAIRPLARKLAVRVAMKRRRSTRGTLDIRRTVRHAMSTGGVPFVTEFRHRPPHRPELVLLCDVSSSVARFARFSLMLTHSLSAQFSRVRSFAFVDAIDEVTHLFEHEDFVAAVDRMNREALVVRSDGHSDYGSILESFLDHHGDVVTARTTLLILGDARNNYRARRTHALRELAHRARHTYWLNPEPIHDWDTGDSAATEYAAHVHRMVEVRNLRQLEAFIAKEL